MEQILKKAAAAIKPPGILNCETKYLENTTTIAQFAQFLIIMYNSILQFSRIYFFLILKTSFESSVREGEK